MKNGKSTKTIYEYEAWNWNMFLRLRFVKFSFLYEEQTSTSLRSAHLNVYSGYLDYVGPQDKI